MASCRFNRVLELVPVCLALLVSIRFATRFLWLNSRTEYWWLYNHPFVYQCLTSGCQSKIHLWPRFRYGVNNSDHSCKMTALFKNAIKLDFFVSMNILPGIWDARVTSLVLWMEIYAMLFISIDASIAFTTIRWYQRVVGYTAFSKISFYNV